MSKEQWKALHEQSRFRPKYPSEVVVQWALTELPDGAHVLDHGCGAGRHTNFLSGEGFTVYRYDTSPAVEAADTLPTEPTFDAVLSYGVLYYLNPEQVKAEIESLKKCVKPGAKGLFVVRSTDTFRLNRGDSDIPQWNWGIGDCLGFCSHFSGYEINMQSVTHHHRCEAEVDWLVKVTF